MSTYRIIRDDELRCQCGAVGGDLLTSGERDLPSFYICGACGVVGRVGVGRVRGRIRIEPKPAAPRGKMERDR